MSLVSFGGSATIVSDSTHTHTLTRAFSRKYCELVLCVFGYRYIQSTTQCVCVCVCVADLDESPDQVPVHTSTGSCEVSVAVPSCLHTHTPTDVRENGASWEGIEN